MNSIFKKIILCFCAVIFLAQCSSSETNVTNFDEHWKDLFFAQQKHDEAKNFCERWLKSSDTAIQVNAHVCLATIIVYDLKDQGYNPALIQIQEALQLDPKNFTLHMLVINLNLFYQLDFTDYLRKVLDIFAESPVEQWLEPLESWFQMKDYEAIRKYLHVLDAQYKNSAKVKSRLGMIYLFLDKADLAEGYLQDSIQLDSSDMSATWSLARIYEMRNQTAKAKDLYEKALSNINPEDQAYPVMQCLYTRFLGESLNDKNAACRYASQNCDEYYEQNCGE